MARVSTSSESVFVYRLDYSARNNIGVTADVVDLMCGHDGLIGSETKWMTSSMDVSTVIRVRPGEAADEEAYQVDLRRRLGELGIDIVGFQKINTEEEYYYYFPSARPPPWHRRPTTQLGACTIYMAVTCLTTFISGIVYGPRIVTGLQLLAVPVFLAGCKLSAYV